LLPFWYLGILEMLFIRHCHFTNCVNKHMIVNSVEWKKMVYGVIAKGILNE